MSDQGSLTTTEILAAASKVLQDGGYNRVDESRFPEWTSANARLFEDPYSIVEIIVYNTWSELHSSWTGAQAILVDVMSKHLRSTEPKAWEGYLVLFTPGVMSRDARVDADGIRYNTSRVRKLVLGEIKSLGDIKRSLLPLLPLTLELQLPEQGSALDVLPALLATKGISEDALHVVIKAFREQQPLIEQLHAYRTKK